MNQTHLDETKKRVQDSQIVIKEKVQVDTVKDNHQAPTKRYKFEVRVVIESEARPRGYKTFFMLNSTEHEISTAYQQNLFNKEVSCFKSHRCCIYNAKNVKMATNLHFNIYGQDKFRSHLS